MFSKGQPICEYCLNPLRWSATEKVMFVQELPPRSMMCCMCGKRNQHGLWARLDVNRVKFPHVRAERRKGKNADAKN